MFAKDLLNKKYHLCSYEIQLVPNGILMIFNSKANNFIRLKKNSLFQVLSTFFFTFEIYRCTWLKEERLFPMGIYVILSFILL